VPLEFAVKAALDNRPELTQLRNNADINSINVRYLRDQTKPQLAVIDAATDKIKAWVELPGLGYGTAATKDGRWLIVAVPPANKVAVIDLKTLKVARSIDVPAAPQEVLVRPDDKVAYVSCDKSHQVAALDLSDWSVNLIDAGKGTDGLAWASR